MYFNPSQPDNWREIKGCKRSGQLPHKTHHPSLTFQEIDEPLSYSGGELSSFLLLRTVFQRQQHSSSKHIPLQANWLWARQLLARFNLGLNVANGNMNHFQHWNRCNIWSRSSWREQIQCVVSMKMVSSPSVPQLGLPPRGRPKARASPLSSKLHQFRSLFHSETGRSESLVEEQGTDRWSIPGHPRSFSFLVAAPYHWDIAEHRCST